MKSQQIETKETEKEIQLVLGFRLTEEEITKVNRVVDLLDIKKSELARAAFWCGFERAVTDILREKEKSAKETLSRLGSLSARSLTQAHRLLIQCPGTVRAYLVLCLYAGVRPEEAMRMNWSDINLETKTVKVDGKTRQRRIVELSLRQSRS